MRLTDKPRTLAETKPDVAWPAELQRTLDKALERDSTLRYHSAAHFGREFAEAISAMPATQAAEAGTLVMGSVAAPPVRDVPATRVRPSSGATVPVEAVPAPVAAKAAAPRPVAAPAAAKSKTPMIAGAGALVAIAAVGLFMFTPWKADGTGSASPDPATVSSQPPATPAGTNDSLEQFSKNAVETPQVDPGTALNPPAPVGTRPQSETKSTAPAPIPANPVNVVADTSDEGANPTLISPRLLRLHEIVTDTLTTEPALRTAIQHSRRIRRNPNLSRMLTADTWYIEMMAFGALFGLHGETDSDRSGACRAAGVIRRHPNPQRASGVKQTVDALDCPAP